MAAAVRKQEEESTVITKSLKIQSVTHQQIIDLGDEIFKKETQKQCEDFERYLAKHEQLLIGKLEQEKKAALEESERQHKKDVDKLKEYYVAFQNEALEKEAARVKDIMNNVTQTIVEETMLHGQRKLHEATVDARECFAVEKAAEIEETIREQEKIAERLLDAERCEHEQAVQRLNEEWQRKMQAQEEENLKQLEILLKQKEAEMERTFTNRLHQSLVDVEMDHKTELANFASEIEAAEHHNNNLNVEIEVLKGRLEEMRTNMLKVLEAFRDFIETSPGFADGQGEFVLDQLVPPKLNEFLLMK